MPAHLQRLAPVTRRNGVVAGEAAHPEAARAKAGVAAKSGCSSREGGAQHIQSVLHVHCVNSALPGRAYNKRHFFPKHSSLFSIPAHQPAAWPAPRWVPRRPPLQQGSCSAHVQHAPAPPPSFRCWLAPQRCGCPRAVPLPPGAAGRHAAEQGRRPALPPFAWRGK